MQGASKQFNTKVQKVTGKVSINDLHKIRKIPEDKEIYGCHKFTNLQDNYIGRNYRNDENTFNSFLLLS